MQSKYSSYHIFDDFVPYKKLKLYPVLMSDYLLFHFFAQCLMLEKNSIADFNVIMMNYLEFIYYMSNEENPYLLMLDGVLRLALRNKDIDIKYGRNDSSRGIFSIEGEVYDGDDLEEIKNIICDQNLLELPDENISKEVRDALRKAQEYRAKTNGLKMASLEDQIVCVLISTSLTLEQIRNLSIRKFVKILERVDHKLHYEIYLSATMSGFVTFKDKSFLKHWMAELGRDKFAGSIAYEDVKGKVNFENATVR